MSEVETTPLKAHLVNFVMALSLGAILLDELSPNRRVRKMQALAIATSDEIKQRVDLADDTQQTAMIVVSRKHLKQVRDMLLRYPIPTQTAKARGEWVANAKQLLKAVEGVGND